MERRLYNAKEIACYLGMSEDAVRKWSIRGYIPFVKLGKSLRFDIIKIDSWIKSKECAYSRKEFS